tara:strand:+ start:143 stop:445 length:303 start_codon:yes stop_codon:yes gene_type:complete
METTILRKIEALESEIEKALGENNFVKISDLSTRIGTAIKELTDNCLSNTSLPEEDIEILKHLRERVEFFEKETEKKFKSFRGKTSIQKKMHTAYTKYGI